jgi:hypothetical protein
MGQVTYIHGETVIVHEGHTIPIPPAVARAILDFARDKSSGKLEINFADGGVAGVISTRSQRYK